MIKAIIFDMDGLMIDSEGKQSAAMEQVLKEHGAEPVPDKTGVVQIVGMRARDNLQRLKDRHGLAASVEDLHRRKNEIYRELLTEGVDIMPGLIELLADLENAPVTKALASSSSHDDIHLVLKHLGLQRYFDAVVSGHDVKAGKPAPDTFLEAAVRLKVDPAHCLVLEDASTGIQAAKAAGMKAIAVESRYSSGQDFSQAALVVSSLEKLNWKIIKNI